MFRSVVFINEENIKNIDDNIFEADVFIVDQAIALKYLSKTVISDNDFFKKILSIHKLIYITMNNLEIKKDYKMLDMINGKLINGIFLKNTNLKSLNKFTLKLREYEANSKLVFGSLNIIASVDNLEAFSLVSKISNYARVIALYLDSVAINRDLFINNHNLSNEIHYLKERIVVENAKGDKYLIDSLENLDDKALDYLRKIGFSGKATNDYKNIKPVNNLFSPNKDEIAQALNITKASYQAFLNKEKYAIYEGKKISVVSLKKARNILEKAKYLGLLDQEIPPLVKKRKVVVKKAPPVKFYSLGEEIANAISHGFGALFGVIALVLLVIKGIETSKAEYIISGIIFGVAIILLYLASTIYHSLSLRTYAKQIFRRFDHTSIYVLIAGSYTPFLLVLLNDYKAVIVTIFMWVIAITGIVLKILWINKFQKIHLGLYIALGWLPAMFFGSNILNLGSIGLGLLIAGGVAYTVGVIFYALKLFKFTHMVWHLFCILGTVLHFVAVYVYL